VKLKVKKIQSDLEGEWFWCCKSVGKETLNCL